MPVEARDRNKQKSMLDKKPGFIKDNGSDLVDELFENEKSIGFKAKNGGFPFKGEGAKKKAMEQARKMKAEKK